MGPERILPAQQFAFTSDPNNAGRASNDNTYAIGDEVLVQVTFSTDVTVTGSPRLELNVGGGDEKPASYSGVNGASRLLFRALLHESSLARTMPTDRILTGRCGMTLVGRGRSSD